MGDEFQEVIDQLWLHSTNEEDPFCVDRAFAAIKEHGEFAIDGLIWALGHKDLDLKMLALRLVREFGKEARRALPAVERCFEDERMLVRVTARETLIETSHRPPRKRSCDGGGIIEDLDPKHLQ